MKTGGHGFNDINERLVRNEQKLVFTAQKFPQTVGVRAKKKKGRECQRNFPKILKTLSGLLESASGSRRDPRVSGSPSLSYTVWWL